MKKWNMIIDVAECTNCNLCTLATMDEYVGNDWPGYSKPMPKHGHKWINILQKERGQVPMIDIAYVPTMCNHCDDAPCLAKGDGAVNKRDDGIMLIDPEQGEGPQGPGRRLPLRAHLVERGASGSADLAVRRAPDRSGLAADPRPPVVPDRRHARDQGRGRRDGADGARGGPRSDEARSWRPSRASITAISGATRNASSAARWRRRPTASSIASRARACGSIKGGTLLAEAASDNYGDFKFDRLDENSGRYLIEISAPGRAKKTIEASARRQHQSRRDTGCRQLALRACRA